MKLLEKLSERQLGALALAGLAFAAPLIFALLFGCAGVCARAWHWMLGGF